MAAFQHEHWRPALAFIEEFMGRRIAWPPDALAVQHFGRPWFTRDFEHTAARADDMHVYAVFELAPLDGSDKDVRLWHFAYRHATLFGGRWLQYGYVVRTPTTVKLVHINGHQQWYAGEEPEQPTRVETYFGHSPAQFRVASLHPFSIERRRGMPTALSRVQFPS